MVGLPARGKTFVATKLARYLAWRGQRAEVFNVGAYRRRLFGAKQSHEFFDPKNKDTAPARELAADAALTDLLAFFAANDAPGVCGIYDATNTTRARRTRVREVLANRGIDVLTVELVCNQESLISQSIHDVKLRGPDYTGMSPDLAVQDFLQRMNHYASVYEPVNETEGHAVRIDEGERMVARSPDQPEAIARVVDFVASLRRTKRPVLLTRHGESIYNVLGRLGGDSSLSSRGEEFALSLARFVRENEELRNSMVVWTSELLRTKQTASLLPQTPRVFRALNEISAGICEGKTYEEIERELPEVFFARRANKFTYQYPKGESYADLITRLEPVVLEMEREERPLLIVAHQAVLRALLSYMLGIPREQCPHQSVALHTLVELRTEPHGILARKIPLDATEDIEMTVG